MNRAELDIEVFGEGNSFLFSKEKKHGKRIFFSTLITSTLFCGTYH